MRILGIDPGTIRVGYGLIDYDNPDIAVLECGTIRAPAKDPIERRLWRIYREIRSLIKRHRPSIVAVEEPFVVRAPRRSALAVGEARAIALLAAVSHDLPVVQYPPAKVRQTVAGYGRGDKEQVVQALGLLLGISLDAYTLDATDALAVAVCHTQHTNLEAMLAEAAKGPAP